MDKINQVLGLSIKYYQNMFWQAVFVHVFMLYFFYMDQSVAFAQHNRLQWFWANNTSAYMTSTKQHCV